MGYYEGQRENPCPRCGGVVATLFISVSPMSFSQRCRGCGTTEFTKAEEARLTGSQLGSGHIMTGPEATEPRAR